MILEISTALFVAVFGYILVKYAQQLLQLKNYPPGPWPLPVIGNLHLLGKKPHKALSDLAQKYGPVMGFSFGSERVVMVQGIKEAKELLVTKGQFSAGMTITIVC